MVIDDSLGDTSALNDLAPREEEDEDELMGLEVPAPTTNDPVARLDELESRLRMLENGVRHWSFSGEFLADVQQRHITSGQASTDRFENRNDASIAPGWRAVGQQWRPCPIGVFV